MYFAFYWMDRWLKIMEACAAEQARELEASEHSKPAFDEEVAYLRTALADRDEALSEAMRRGKALEAELASWRETASERQVALSRADGDRARDLERDQAARAEAQAEIDRLRRLLKTAEADRASAQEDCHRKQSELAERQAEADRDRKSYDHRLAELTRAAEDSERRLQREQTAGAEAQAEIDRLRHALKQAETERTAARTEVERLHHQLTEARAAADRDRNDQQARRTAADRRFAESEEPAPARASSLNASQSGRRAKTKTMTTQGGTAIVESDAAGPAVPASELAAPGLTLHFKKPADWAATVFVYYWDTDPPTETPQWPGVPLAAEENGWFAHCFSRMRSAHLVFNDNAGKQTQNLYRDRSGWLAADGTWHDEPGPLT